VSRGDARRRTAAPKNAREAVEALLREELGRRGFRPDLENEARGATQTAERRSPPRRDLTALDTFTIDPTGARDFDDAISAQQEGDAVRAWVHIADVSAHVPPGSPLDREALRRANSTYVPGDVEPMLPRVLSEDACSLAPGVERLAVTAEIELEGDGAVRAASFYRSRIRSDVRLDYDRVDAIFAGREPAPESIAEPLAVARRIAAALGERRGPTSLDVESSEPEFEFDAAGDVVAARSVPQTESHRLIERLMILANEQVAQLLERKRLPTIYRVHAQPDPPRVERLIEQLHDLGIPTPPLRPGISAQEAGEIAAQASRLVGREATRRGHGRGAYTSLVLRSLKPAQYSEQNTGHAGLGSPAYCHFTSPIRRYPDLIVHRALLAALGEGEEAPRAGEAHDVAAHCSERERESMKIERDADDVCAAFLLKRELAADGLEKAFEGEVSGVIRSGVFVEFGGSLGDVYEGFLPARRLRDEDFLELNETETALVGKRSGRRVQMGDPVSVRTTGVEAARGRVDLEPVAAAGEGGDPKAESKPRAMAKSKAKTKTKGKGMSKAKAKGKAKAKAKARGKTKNKGKRRNG
jgi:ribonuclease R